MKIHHSSFKIGYNSAFTSRLIANFVSNIVALATGHPRGGVNLSDAVKLAVPKNHTIEPKITILSCQFTESLIFPWVPLQIFCLCFLLGSLLLKAKYTVSQKTTQLWNAIAL